MESVANVLLFKRDTVQLKRDTVQRLFSNFADGWPGVGLLLLRLLTGAAMITLGTDAIRQGTPSVPFVLPIICVLSGILLAIGLFTPLTAALAAIVETGLAVWRFSTTSGDPWIPFAEAVLAAALAMIGPGAWSIDAYLFGRKHIRLSDSQD
jgi:putative oxidoreductase